MITDTSVVVVVRLFVGGELAGEEPVWADHDTPTARGIAERLLPVITAACRFLNTATELPDLTLLTRAITVISLLPAWGLNGVSYLATRNGGTDVVYDLPGQQKALRIVEDEFAEVLGPEELEAWMEERAQEDDFVEGEEDDEEEGDEEDG